MYLKLFPILLVCLIFSCSPKHNSISRIAKSVYTVPLTKNQQQKWHLKCVDNDTIPGISLARAYSVLKDKKSDSVIVAVLDASFDLEHEDLKNSFWINIKEKYNKIDDDRNGFVDDVNGWNFIGGPNNELPLYENYEFVRVVRFYDKLYKHKIDTTSLELKAKYNYYLKAKKYLDRKVFEIERQLEYGKTLTKDYYEGLDAIKSFVKSEEKLTIELIDSLKKVNPNLESKIEALRLPVSYGMSGKDLEKDLEFRERLLNIYYNPKFNERKDIGDNPDDLNDNNYGNNLVDGLKDKISHGTYVSGIIAAKRNNNYGIDGIADKVKIMPVVVAVNGEANDKDLALGIRYAVDNGAQIINISINKEFSLHKEWVFDAIKYAATKDVLIISAAGNDNVNLDNSKNFYPNDSDYLNKEISDNFIMVGGTTFSLNSNLKYEDSNYGSETVDIMAPAYNIYTTASNNKYEFVDGTSFAAPVVTGVATLIKSYYPKLKANEIKEILMNSGTSYNIMIKVSNNTETEKLIPFSSVCKSGKIVNAYNSILLAEELVN